MQIYQNLRGVAKEVLRGKHVALNAYIGSLPDRCADVCVLRQAWRSRLTRNHPDYLSHLPPLQGLLSPTPCIPHCLIRVYPWCLPQETGSSNMGAAVRP